MKPALLFLAACATAAQPRPVATTPMISSACGIDDITTCSALCSRQNGGACNNLGIIEEKNGGGAPMALLQALPEYQLACHSFGSAEGCSNYNRVLAGQSYATRVQTLSEGMAKSINAASERVKHEQTEAAQVDPRTKVLQIAAKEMDCSDVHIAAQLDRRFVNSASLRYLVEGCGKRASYVEDCTKPVCEYLLSALVTIP